MITETKIKRENGDTITIRVTLFTFQYGTDYSGNKYRYDVAVFTRKAGKRTDVLLPEALIESAVSADEIYAGKINLWNAIKPTL